VDQNINDNPISKRFNERYELLDENIKKELEKLDESDPKEYQLQVIKRKRILPQKGDVFLVSPRKDLFFKGVVVNSNISNINGEELLLIFILKNKKNKSGEIYDLTDVSELLIAPVMVGREYWTRGYFYNTGENIEIPSEIDYGFYSIGKGMFMDEYGNEIVREPELLGTFGVATITGVSYEINVELIIDKTLNRNFYS
jgi:hypothetical protein